MEVKTLEESTSAINKMQKTVWGVALVTMH